MDKLGYIKNIAEETKKLGGKIIDIQLIKNTVNHLNPTACYVISPPQNNTPRKDNSVQFSVPGTNMPLIKHK